MDFWIKAAQLILSLSLLVVLHEFGHYVPARIFKTRVEKFYLFFNWKFSLFKKKIGETEWGIGWIPLGGYVKISGMIDESMDKEQMSQPAQPWEFRSKPAWQRLIIMIGGVVVNLILGMVIYIFIVFNYGEEQVASEDLKLGMAIHPYLEQYGLQSGDNILEIDGEKVMHYNDIARGLIIRGQKTIGVQHANGSMEEIVLPEDIDYKLFESGATHVADLRHKSTEIGTLTTIKASKNKQFKASDFILEIDNRSISEIDFSSSELRSKGHKVTVVREGDTLDISANKADFLSLLKIAPAMSAGLKINDKIIKINNREITYFDEISSELYKSRNKNAKFTVLRGGEEFTTSVYVQKLARVGFSPKNVESTDQKAAKTVYYGFGESIGKGIERGYTTLSDYAGQLKFLFTKKGASSMGGFGAIGNLFPSTWQWRTFWEITAFISIILAFMNILPIPALDGGHVVFLLYEMITGKEAPEKVLEIAQYIGFFLIIGLVLYANGNDLFRALFD